MEFRHIRYFIAVADTLNFSKAAEQLHICQPPLSRQIRQLEEELGVELFSRKKRRVELTYAGRVFLEEAKKLSAQVEHAKETLQRARQGTSDALRIGMGTGLSRALGAAIVEYHRRFRKIDIECKDMFSTLQNEALRTGDIQVGFLRPPVDRVNLECELLYEEKFVVIMSESHRLAGRAAVKLEDIAGEPLILFDRRHSAGLYDKILRLYTDRALVPQIAMTQVEAHEEGGAITLASGKGIFIGGADILRLNRSLASMNLAMAQLDEPDAKIEVYMAWRKNEGRQTVLDFLESVRHVMRPGEQRPRNGTDRTPRAAAAPSVSFPH